VVFGFTAVLFLAPEPMGANPLFPSAKCGGKSPEQARERERERALLLGRRSSLRISM
jgi:hypothetical protein